MQDKQHLAFNVADEDLDFFQFVNNLHLSSVWDFDYSDVINWIMISKFSINKKDAKTRSLLHLAAIKGSIPAMKRYIEGGADVNATHTHFMNNSPLQWTIANANTTCAKWLIMNSEKYGVDLNKVDSLGNTPLHLAVLKGWNHKDKEGKDPLQFKVIIELLTVKTGVNTQNNIGDTPLHYAMVHRDKDCIENLIAKGASLDVVNAGGFTPLGALSVPYDKTKKILELGGVYTLENEQQWQENKSKIYSLICPDHELIAKIQDDIFSHHWQLAYGGGENVYRIKNGDVDQQIKVSKTAKLMLETIEEYWREEYWRLTQQPDLRIDSLRQAAKNCLEQLRSYATKGANRSKAYNFFHQQFASSVQKYTTYTAWIDKREMHESAEAINSIHT